MDLGLLGDVLEMGDARECAQLVAFLTDLNIQSLEAATASLQGLAEIRSDLETCVALVHETSGPVNPEVRLRAASILRRVDNVLITLELFKTFSQQVRDLVRSIMEVMDARITNTHPQIHH